MGSKRNYVERMAKCEDWVVWVDPKTYRLLRLMGCNIPCGVRYARDDRKLYVFNGDYSFTQVNTSGGRHQVSSFASEDEVYQRFTSWVSSKSNLSIDSFGDSQVLYNKLLSLKEDDSKGARELALKYDMAYQLRYHDSLEVFGGKKIKIKGGDEVFFRADYYEGHRPPNKSAKVPFSHTMDSEILLTCNTKVERL